MKPLFLLLLLLVYQPSFAALYRCNTAANTVYQDKPCSIAQSQREIAQAPQQPQNPLTHSAQTTLNSQALPQFSTAFVSGAVNVQRDAHGKIKRSEQAKSAFKAAVPCPANANRSGACPGYVIDHIKPLACGGADSPENMQWQTEAQGKAKDAWERDGCQLPATNLRHLSVNSGSAISTTPATEKQPQMVFIGPRGGRYVLTKSGKKRYLKH